MSSSSIAHAFAKLYYTRLSNSPELVYRFYGSDATVLYGVEGSSNESAVSKGSAEIKAKFAEDEYKNVLYLIRDVAAVPTAQNSILVTVLGEFAKKESSPQQFSQTFVLARTAEDSLYILSDIKRVFNPEFDAEIQPETGAVDEARQLVDNVTLKDAEPETAPNPNPNSWASILAQPTLPTPKPAPRVAVPAAPAAAPRAPGPYSAFLKLSSATAITKPGVLKALAPFGPVSNLQLDLTKKRGYVDFPDKRMFDKALNAARVKIPGGRESVEILKRFTGPPPHAPKTNGNAAGGSNSRGNTGSSFNHKGGKSSSYEKH